MASISHPARTPRPTVAPAADTGDGPRRGVGLRFWAVRAPDFDLLERLPERAAVLLGML
ncbi:hypothetical protein MGAD_15620 [Mycolicibacterium gadium]|uniref:Uncharacterized protein n=1 Tax=Mycolicibacterium gadium TaxID=1794 RepID=A0A7I7WK85_MYCGU|nr:hypothetical protein MGAD_15620 [Mycolicibacterium gadium]